MIFQEKSAEAFEAARKEIVRENLQSKQVKDALALYLEDWCNVIHPGLIWLTGEATNADSGAILRAQTAMLLLTAALDIHDDIIDCSSIKNGKPTVFGRFGTDIALLLGNAFFVKGFTSLNSLEDFIARERVKLVFLTAQEAFFRIGDAHALEVQMRDHEETPLDEYWRIVNMKACGLQADARIGALLGRARGNEVEVLTSYGHAIGKLEILRDDFIDIFDAEELCNRLRTGCPPMPVLYVFQDKKKKKKIQDSIQKGIADKKTDAIVDMILESKEVHELRREMCKIAEKTIEMVKALPTSTRKRTMTTLARAMLEDIDE